MTIDKKKSRAAEADKKRQCYKIPQGLVVLLLLKERLKKLSGN